MAASARGDYSGAMPVNQRSDRSWPWAWLSAGLLVCSAVDAVAETREEARERRNAERAERLESERKARDARKAGAAERRQAAEAASAARAAKREELQRRREASAEAARERSAAAASAPTAAASRPPAAVSAAPAIAGQPSGPELRAVVQARLDREFNQPEQQRADRCNSGKWRDAEEQQYCMGWFMAQRQRRGVSDDVTMTIVPATVRALTIRQCTMNPSTQIYRCLVDLQISGVVPPGLNPGPTGALIDVVRRAGGWQQIAER